MELLEVTVPFIGPSSPPPTPLPTVYIYIILTLTMLLEPFPFISLSKEFSRCHKLKFSNPYILAT